MQSALLREEIPLWEEIPDDEALLDELIDLVDKSLTSGPSNNGFSDVSLAPLKKRSVGKGLWRAVSSILFYGALALVILVAFVYSAGPGEVKSLMGYSYFTVMTPSMRSSIPPGSFIVTKKTEASELQIGDVITFFASGIDETVTHRIVEVIPDSELQFRTKGDDNHEPDSEPVPGSRVIGKVVFHVKYLGSVMLLLKQHIGWVLAIFFLLFALSLTLGWVFRKEVAPMKPPPQQKQQQKPMRKQQQKLRQKKLRKNQLDPDPA